MNISAPATSPLLATCPETLPRAAYTDPDWYAREQRTIWARNWVHVGRRDGFAPGTIRRVTVAGESVIVACSPEGDLRAHLNVCRHRGAELCAHDTQDYNGRLIHCPYHAWAYAHDGRLVSTAFATPGTDFDKSQYGLYPVALKEWNGFVFLCLADTPPPFAPDLGVHALDNWPMERLVTGHVLETRLACNWKVFWENYNECLHCPGIHKGLSEMVPLYARGIMSEPEDRAWTPDSPSAPALKEGARSWTVDGQPCGPEFEGLTDAERAIAHTFVTTYPTMYVIAHVDYVRAVTVTPLAPEETLVRAEWLFLPETLAAHGFDLENVTRFASTVIAEDGAACEMNQRGLRSSRHETGRLMPEEFDIHRFHRWVLEQMEAQDA